MTSWVVDILGSEHICISDWSSERVMDSIIHTVVEVRMVIISMVHSSYLVVVVDITEIMVVDSQLSLEQHRISMGVVVM